MIPYFTEEEENNDDDDDIDDDDNHKTVCMLPCVNYTHRPPWVLQRAFWLCVC